MTRFSLRIFVAVGDPDGLLTQQNQRRWASYRVAGDPPIGRGLPSIRPIGRLVCRGIGSFAIGSAC